MKKLLLSTVAVFALASAASAADIGGEVTLDFAENEAGNWAGTAGLELIVYPSATTGVALGFLATPGEDFTLDTWTVGAALGYVNVFLGNDNSVFVEGEGGQTLSLPTMTESIKIEAAGASVALGFTDWGSDISDISNIQGAYTLAMGNLSTTISADYNMEAEDFVIGTAISGVEVASVNLGTVVTYDNASSSIGYEAIAKLSGITAYVNGDDSEMLQNVGGEYVYSLGKADLTAGAVYNFDSEEFIPKVGLTFAF